MCVRDVPVSGSFLVVPGSFLITSAPVLWRSLSAHIVAIDISACKIECWLKQISIKLLTCGEDVKLHVLARPGKCLAQRISYSIVAGKAPGETVAMQQC